MIQFQQLEKEIGALLQLPWPLWLMFTVLCVAIVLHFHKFGRNLLYRTVVSRPYFVLAFVVGFSVYFAMQLPGMRWETNARVFFPKDHPAMLYNNQIEEIFGVKEPIIIGVVNESKGIYNRETLQRIKRITDGLYELRGVVAERKIDIVSLSSATFFTGNETGLDTVAVMPRIPQDQAEMQALKKRIRDNADLFEGNIVSADGKAAMIRVKVKENIQDRYQTYFAIKNWLLSREMGSQEPGSGGQWGNWKQGNGQSWGKSQGGGSGSGGGQWGSGAWKNWQSDPVAGKKSEKKNARVEALKKEFELSDLQAFPAGNAAKEENKASSPQAQWPGQGSKQQASTGAAAKGTNNSQGTIRISARENGDEFYLAGRPVIEVNYGLQSMEDLWILLPFLVLVLLLALAVLFRTGLGTLLPMATMIISIIWCMGTMVAMDIPMYTISVMVPVILIAVGIGAAVHLLGHYYQIVLQDPQQDRRRIVSQLLNELAMPLVATSATTAAGFLSLTLAEMPPLKVFGMLTALGVLYAWLLAITLIPAMLVLVKPKVGAYLEKKRQMRLHNEEGLVSRMLVSGGRRVLAKRTLVIASVAIMAALAAVSTRWLEVDSSWVGDFRGDSDIVRANKMLNDKFSGTVFLNVIVDTGKKDGIKNLEILKRIEKLQQKVEKIPEVGDSLSLVDHLKSINQALHNEDPAYKVLPPAEAIGQFLFFASLGRQDLLAEVVENKTYQMANVTFHIKSDRISTLKRVIDTVREDVVESFQGMNLQVNTAGMANNSYVWSDLLIRSQVAAIVISKLAVFLLASLILRSVVAGLLVVIPVVISTLWVAATMVVFSVPLDVSTTLAAGIAIGAGVDFAIHYIYRYMREHRDGLQPEEAAIVGLRKAGRTIVMNAMVVSAGFLVLFASQFPPNSKTGYFVTTYMVLSCLVALLFLPAVLSAVNARFVRGGVSTDAMTVTAGGSV